jgi:dynactin complex subunit
LLITSFQFQTKLTVFVFELQLGELVKKIEQELQDSKQELTEKQVQYEKCVSMVSELEQTIRTYGSEREGRLKALEKTIKSLKSEMQSMSKQLKVACFPFAATTDLSLNL